MFLSGECTISTIMSDGGKLNLSNKSGIVRCLEDGSEGQDDINPIVEVVILDGPDIMYVLKHVVARNARICPGCVPTLCRKSSG